MKKLLGIVLGCMALQPSMAQDIQLSQYYAAPLYLNPAFTGNLDYECRRLPGSRLRFIGNYRNQHIGNFTTYMGSIDYRSRNGNWGLGGLFSQDQQNANTAGNPPLNTFSASGLVSYKLSITNNWKLHSGVQLGYQNKSLNVPGYSFPDEFTTAGRVLTTNEALAIGPSRGYFDAGAGLLVFNSDFYIGASVHHLNQANTTLTGDIDRLPMKLDVHTGYRISFTHSRGFATRGGEKSITPVVHYKRQLQAQQLDLGTYFNYEYLVLGAWYRGVPFAVKPEGGTQTDAVVLLAGVRAPTDYGLFKIGLSYDFPVSYNTINSGRTFELSLAYQFIDERCRKRISYRNIPCPGI